MWIKIDMIDVESNILYFPKAIAKTITEAAFVCFGKKKVLAQVKELEDIKATDNYSFDTPKTIKISKNLLEKLLIVDSLTYQLVIDKGDIVIGPVIGLLIGDRNHLYNPDYMRKYSDRFGVYSKFGGLIYAFSGKSVDWDNNIAYGLYYDNGESQWRYGKFPLPTVIYRRNFHMSDRIVKKLINVTDGRLFNSTRFTKYELYKFVEKNKHLSKYLIPTELSLNIEGVKKFIKNYEKIIFKPIDLSRGRGICIIEKMEWGYKILDYRNKECVETHLGKEDALEAFLKSNKSFFDKYLIQQYIDLAKVDGSCFDIRVVMQKDSNKVWVCTGIECRVAKKNSRITNISRGGYALPLSKAITKAFPNYPNRKLLMWRLGNFCKKFCNHMDEMGEHFAEFGMDVAFDRNKGMWLIEANVFPSFKGFKVMDYDNYLNIRYSPLIYAVSLTEFYESVSLKGDKNE